jgi:hypothetical protein
LNGWDESSDDLGQDVWGSSLKTSVLIWTYWRQTLAKPSRTIQNTGASWCHIVLYLFVHVWFEHFQNHTQGSKVLACSAKCSVTWMYLSCAGSSAQWTNMV